MPEGMTECFLTVHFWKSLSAGSLKAVLSVDQWSRYDCGGRSDDLFLNIK